MAALRAAPALAASDRIFAEKGSAPSEYTDPFVWDDMVLRGTVLSVESLTIPAADWFPPAILKYRGDRPVDILNQTVRVHEMLRGCTGDSVVVLQNLNGGDEQETRQWISRISGQEAIITIRVSQQPHPAWHSFGEYVRAGSGWTEAGGDKADTLSEANIRESVARVSVQRMTAESDLVVRAEIVSEREVGVPGSSHPEFSVRPTLVLKGHAVGNLAVEATSTINPADGSQWRTMLGSDLKVGTSWYMFLTERGDGAFQPTACWRSTIRIDGDRLFERYDDPSCYSPSSLEDEIRRAARR